MAPKLHLYFDTPEPIFKARVNMPPVEITYPANSIDYDTVTLGDWEDIPEGSLLTLGTTEEGDDLGRIRVKIGEEDNIRIARSSKGNEDGMVDIRDNAYITVWDDFRVYAKLPYYAVNSEGEIELGSDYKDGNIPPEDNNTNLPPKANAGPWMAGYIGGIAGVLEVELPGGGVNTSFALADGASISSYLWDVGDGTITVGSASSAVITATFPVGRRWVSLTVTDSNGKTHTCRCFILAIDADNDPSYTKFKLSQNMEIMGQTLDIELYADAPRTTYPDGTLVLFWWGEAADKSDRSHMKFCGWVDNENAGISRNRLGLMRTTTIHCSDITHRMQVLPGFSQALERDTTAANSLWSYMPSLDMFKALWYLGHWHSTVFNIADFIMPSGLADYNCMRLDATANNLFDQIDSMAQKITPDHYFVNNSMGQLLIVRDWMLDDSDDRPEEWPQLDPSSWSDLQMQYNRNSKVHCLNSGAVLVSTDFIEVEGEGDVVPTVYSIAPGDSMSFGQGLNEQTHGNALALSQDDLNKCEGHRYARLNSRYGQFRWTDPSGLTFWEMEPALFRRTQIEIVANLAPQRGLSWTTASGLVKSISVDYNHTRQGMVIRPTITWEMEVNGYPATTKTYDLSKDVGYTPDPAPVLPPADPGLFQGQDLVAAFSTEAGSPLYRTFDFTTTEGSGGPTWEGQIDVGIEDTRIYSFVVDPFSPGYINQDGTGEVRGYVATEVGIYRVDDLFGEPNSTLLYTFATALTPSSVFTSRTIGASFGRYFEDQEDNPWLICISHYADTSGHTGTYCVYSMDAGATWNGETTLSTFYDSDVSGSEARNVPALWMSPRVPGYAISCAYTATANPAQSVGYYTTDWGATWTAIASAEDPVEQLPAWGYWTDDAGSYTYLGLGVSKTVTSTSISVNNDDVSDEEILVIAPPADTKQMTIRVEWSTERTSTGGSGSAGGGITLEDSGADVDRTGDSNFAQATTNGGVLSGSFDCVYDFDNWASQDWPTNRDDLEGGPMVAPGGVRVKPHTGADSATGQTRTCYVTVVVTVLQIVLDDDTTYTPVAVGAFNPGNRLGGDIHVPYEDNSGEDIIYFGNVVRGASLQYNLKRQNADGTVTDISPTVSSKQYGVNRTGFAIRAYDGDRQKMAFGGSANDSTAVTSGDFHSVFTSTDGGDNWTSRITPVAQASFGSQPGYGVAFERDTDQGLYIWGEPGTGTGHIISYSADFGATIDKRSGNIPAGFGSAPDGFVGIAGGPYTAP